MGRMEPIQLKQTYAIRSRPDVLYRLVCDPKRRLKWDKALRQAEFLEPEGKLQVNSNIRYRLAWRFGGGTFKARYAFLQPPNKATIESLNAFGVVAKITQQWGFRPVPGGTEVTFSLTVMPRWKIFRNGVSRLAQSIFAETLIELQRQVDANTAEMITEMAKEQAKEMRKKKKKK